MHIFVSAHVTSDAHIRKTFQTLTISKDLEGGGWNKKKCIPAQLLSHFIMQLNIFLPEASHGVLTDGGR